MLRRTRTVAPLLLAASLLSACSSSDSTQNAGGQSSTAPSSGASTAQSPEPSPSGLSKAAFIAQADAICKKANTQVNAIPQPKTPAELQPALAASVKIADSTTTRLEQLVAAQPDADRLKQIFTGPLRQQVTTLQDFLPKVVAAAKKGPQGLMGLQPPSLPKADLPALKQYGFTTCTTTAQTG